MKKEEPVYEPFDINAVIEAAIKLVASEIKKWPQKGAKDAKGFK